MKRKYVELSVVFGLVFATVLSFCGVNAKCESLRSNILRLHIISNSDSKQDQNIKLSVRDEILCKSSCFFSGAKSVDDAVIIARNNINEIERIANGVLKNCGTDYKCKAEIKKEYFNTRVYDDFTLPAGKYNSLVLTLGKGKGHNWWCVVYPGVCVPTSSEKSLETSVDADASEMAYNGNRYIIRFKTVEIYEKIKQNFKK